MNSLRFTVHRRPDGANAVALSGAIDERADLDAVVAAIGDTLEAVLNLEGIDRINSVGVLRWVRFVRALSTRHKVVLEMLSYPLVAQSQTVAGFFGKAQVLSCLAPYFCSSCQQGRMALVSSSEVCRGGPPPARSCEVCGTQMNFDEEDEYLSVLRSSAS
ncbi:MAG: hypothetical protein HYZ28_20755 [Myxococcales bacterium]|nr:hypothetical protein [Myxococcales bacterium]